MKAVGALPIFLENAKIIDHYKYQSSLTHFFFFFFFHACNKLRKSLIYVQNERFRNESRQ